MSKAVPIIIPSYEPDERLNALIESLKGAALGPIVVVDDGSGEKYQKYFEDAKAAGCVVLMHEVNKGKGRALKDAFSYCIENIPDILGCVTADSDGQHTVDDIEKCVNELNRHPECLVMGCRDFSGDDVPWKSSFGNNVTKRVCKYLCGVSVSDTQTGLRAIPAQFMRELDQIKGERFEFETNMLLETKDSYKIIEVPIQTIYESKKEHQTHFRPFVDSFRIYKLFGAKFIKFTFSSLSSSIIDLALFAILCRVLKVDSAQSSQYVSLIDRILHDVTIPTTIIARVVSCIYNYLINYHLVFKSKERSSKSIIKYFSLAVVQMLLSASLVSTVVTFTKGPRLIIKMCIDTILFLISFVIQREFVFKSRKKKDK